MSYRRIFILSIIQAIFPVTYALNNFATPQSARPSSAIVPSSNLPIESKKSKNGNSLTSYDYCFRNSTWIVPPDTLLAYLYDNANFVPVSDQTVWVFSNYDQGYFSGQSYTAIDVTTLSQRYLIGSVTSEGKVFITFYSGSSTSTDLINGVGTLTLKSSGQCFFIMQMNSGQNGVSGLIHWSYMIPVNPGDYYYNNLPGTQMSVPDFLAQF